MYANEEVGPPPMQMSWAGLDVLTWLKLAGIECPARSNLIYPNWLSLILLTVFIMGLISISFHSGTWFLARPCPLPRGAAAALSNAIGRQDESQEEERKKERKKKNKKKKRRSRIKRRRREKIFPNSQWAGQCKVDYRPATTYFQWLHLFFTATNSVFKKKKKTHHC